MNNTELIKMRDALAEKRDTLTMVIDGLSALINEVPRSRPNNPAPAKKKRRKISAAARKRMSAAQKKRWAKKK